MATNLKVEESEDTEDNLIRTWLLAFQNKNDKLLSPKMKIGVMLVNKAIIN